MAPLLTLFFNSGNSRDHGNELCVERGHLKRLRKALYLDGGGELLLLVTRYTPTAPFAFDHRFGLNRAPLYIKLVYCRRLRWSLQTLYTISPLVFIVRLRDRQYKQRSDCVQTIRRFLCSFWVYIDQFILSKKKV